MISALRKVRKRLLASRKFKSARRVTGAGKRNWISASVKVRADLPAWNELFQQVPGFLPVGREYSRPYWRNIWEWTPENERAATRMSGLRRRR